MTGSEHPPDLLALLPVRHGVLPVGAVETAVEAGGRAWIVGSGTAEAVAELGSLLTSAHTAELGPFGPALWSAWLASRLPAHASILLPHSPDGRDLAPRLAATLVRPLVANAVRLGPGWAEVARHGGLAMDVVTFDGPVVATLQIGFGAPPEPAPGSGPAPIAVPVENLAGTGDGPAAAVDAELLAELDADPATMDLAESPRIVAVGAGLGDRSRLPLLEAVADALGASVGATRLVTDWGWLPADRQIGTTGVMVHPRLYLALGISGAVQHTAGLGHPAHIVAVNTDPSCPMMELADLALVCDASAFLAELAVLLAVEEPGPAAAGLRMAPSS